MFLFILAIIFALIAIACIVIAKSIKVDPEASQYKQHEANDTKFFTYIGGGVMAAGAIITIFFACIVSVSTKNVGIVTAFGRPSGELSNGLHFIKPWEKVTEMQANIQTDTYLNKTDQGNDGCVDVRIANQSVACVEVTIRWRIEGNSAQALFRDYKTFDHVRDSLVTRELRAALNDQFATYNPLAILQSGSVPKDILDEAGTAVQGKLKTEIGNQIDVLSVIIPIVNFDESTQGKINAFQAAQADTRIATQQVLTAEQRAKANKILSNSLKNDPLVLTSQCLDLLAKGATLPAGMQCFPNTGGSVVIPGGK